MSKKRFFSHELAHYLFGRALKLSWLERLSLLEIRSAINLPWHSHGQTEIIFCLKGTLHYELQGLPSATVPTGCHIIVPSDTLHRTTNGIDEPNMRLSLFLTEAPPRSPDGQGPLSQGDISRIRERLSGRRPVVRGSSPLLRALIAQIASRIRSARPLTSLQKAELRAIVSAALVYVAEKPANQTFRQPPRLIEKAVEWMEAHFAERISVDQLCAHMGYGRTQLNKLFKSHTGLSPINWLIHRRLNHARGLLAGSALQVSAVARRSGFTDPAFFARVFKTRIGLTPRAYRRSTPHPAGTGSHP